MASQTQQTYFIVERATGRVVGTSAVYDVASGQHRKQSKKEILGLFRLPEGLTASDIDIVETQLPSDAYSGGYRMDMKHRRLVPKLKLHLKPARTEIDGNGQDSVEIDIEVFDEHDHIAEDFQDTLKVTTTHGRLSTKGGQIQVDKGRGSIVLTATHETIEQVWVSVRDPLERCDAARIAIEFL